MKQLKSNAYFALATLVSLGIYGVTPTQADDTAGVPAATQSPASETSSPQNSTKTQNTHTKKHHSKDARRTARQEGHGDVVPGKDGVKEPGSSEGSKKGSENKEEKKGE